MRTQDPLVMAYVVKGFWQEVRDKSIRVDSIAAASGEIGIMSELIDFAKLDDALYEEIKDVGENGLVWCYEISEPFGAALAQHVANTAEWPDETAARAMLRTIYDNATRRN